MGPDKPNSSVPVLKIKGVDHNKDEILEKVKTRLNKKPGKYPLVENYIELMSSKVELVIQDIIIADNLPEYIDESKSIEDIIKTIRSETPLKRAVK